MLSLCISVVIIQLMFNGTVLRMFHLYNSQRVLENRIADIQVKKRFGRGKIEKTAIGFPIFGKRSAKTVLIWLEKKTLSLFFQRTNRFFQLFQETISLHFIRQKRLE